MHEVDIGDQVYDRFKWTGTRDYIRDSEIYKATRPGDCVVLNTYDIYIAHNGRLKKYARDCERRSSFMCELEKSMCLEDVWINANDKLVSDSQKQIRLLFQYFTGETMSK